MKKPTKDEIMDMFKELEANPKFNEALASRLELVSSWLKSEAWIKGVSIYLYAAQQQSVSALYNKPSATLEDLWYSRGFVAALTLVLSLPNSVSARLAASEKSPPPEGY